MVLNGRLPDSMLTAIPGTSRRVVTILAPQVAAFREAFEARFGKPLVITDAYRTYDEQVALKALKGPYAATPGTSKHGWGTALDLGSGVQASFTSPEHLWMRANGYRYGVTHPTWAHNHNPADGQDEPWHVELTFVPASSYAPTPEADMPLTQADLEAIDRIVVDRMNQILNQREADGVLTQTDKEAVDKLIIDRTAQALGPLSAAVGALRVGGVTLDYAALAKAVNDDAARRMSS
jgi:hypothetical protein